MARLDRSEESAAEVEWCGDAQERMAVVRSGPDAETSRARQISILTSDGAAAGTDACAFEYANMFVKIHGCTISDPPISTSTSAAMTCASLRAALSTQQHVESAAGRCLLWSESEPKS
jgi:hypothetical protein